MKNGVFGGVLSLFASSAYAGSPTPGEIEGPFYPVFAQKDQDFDLTRIKGKQGVAKGKIIIIQGQVLDTDGQPLENATVDLWQANAAGRYRHPHDSNKAPLDPNFQGWAIVPSGKDGKFYFKTIYPGTYPASNTWQRPPHIHYKVSKKGYIELITQMYFPDHKLNDLDLLLNRKSKDERKLMIASKVRDKPETYQYNILLQKA
ncbi:protocatechuate 3,4-dioxygenase [Dolichospermum circinale CS-539]|nr:protocatechuate 3,4-dioxygenase [Dolichospermum circinale]MDB9468633.1 protocatechuate 3,4-dioxygenase [Dolichospermum circinale CS-539/09]MDB9471494.1 protocatechuate 3,4-dioxygenase [Dolichospermum circinale CS-539]